MLHELKTYPKYFQETIEGNKLFEIRKNDRNFQVGDVLLLKEWDNIKYTGREVGAMVRYGLIQSQRSCHSLLMAGAYMKLCTSVEWEIQEIPEPEANTAMV